MPSRVERNYNKNRTNKRTIKNKELYENSDYKIISNAKDILNDKVELEPARCENSILKTERLTSFIMEEEKERDINKILKLAKNNRDDDELEKKRKLDKQEYNITKKININDEEEVSKFRSQTKKVVEDEEELTNLIDTIYSKTSTSNDLFDDLMPTSTEETLISDTLDFDTEKKEEKKNLSNSFFTSSLELNDEDLIDDITDIEDEYESISDDDNFLEEDKPIFLKIFITITLVIIFIAVVGYIIYNYFV